MLKQSLFYLLASVLVVLFSHPIQLGLIYLDQFYTYINVLIAPIFSEAALGQWVHRTLVLICIPLIVVGVPTLVYRLIKGKPMPHMIALTWCVWLVLLLCILLIR